MNVSAELREEYLLMLYFGASSESKLSLCLNRAYRDLSRTIHGIRIHPSRAKIYAEVFRLLQIELTQLLNSSTVTSQREFDDWHRSLTASLCERYLVNDFADFTVGQAQKWINMTFKYAIAFGESRMPGASRLFRWLHIPIDSVILAQLAAFNGPVISVPWSRLKSYDEYLALQKWIRTTFRGEAPMDVEFRLWQKGMRDSANPSV